MPIKKKPKKKMKGSILTKRENKKILKGWDKETKQSKKADKAISRGRYKKAGKLTAKAAMSYAKANATLTGAKKRASAEKKAKAAATLKRYRARNKK